MKYKIIEVDGKLVVKITLGRNESVDMIEYDRLLGISTRGFLKPQRILKGKFFMNDSIEFYGAKAISLYDFLKNPISKKDFFYILEHIVVAEEKMAKNKIKQSIVNLNTQQVFFNSSTREVQFLCVPVKEFNSNSTLFRLVETIVYSCTPKDGEDDDFITKFVHYMGELNQFSLKQIEKYIRKEDKSIVEIIRRQNVGNSGFITNKQKEYVEYYGDEEEKNTDIFEEDEEATGLLDEENPTNRIQSYYAENRTEQMGEDGTGLLTIDYGTMDMNAYEYQQNNIDEDATGLLNSSSYSQFDDGSGPTGLLNEEEDCPTGLLNEDYTTSNNIEYQNVVFPFLIHTNNNEKISVNKPVFRIGKEKSYVDYFVANNDAVSRSHADIITRGNRYYVKDLNSKNKTYINDRQLPIKQEIEIQDGDCLKIANEEFIFYI